MTEPSQSLVERRDLLHRGRDPFALPPRLLELCKQGTPGIVQFPQGMTGWLLCRHKDVRAALIDSERLSSVDAPSRHLLDDYDLGTPAEPGALLRNDGTAHARLRSRLQAEFTMRRIDTFATSVQSIIDSSVDQMLQAGTTADLVSDVAQRVSAHSIGALLGVPAAHRDSFLTHSVNDPSPPREERLDTDAKLREYVSTLLTNKAQHPGDDLLSRLVAANRTADALTPYELVTIATTLLVAAHETTASQIALSFAALLTYPDQWRHLCDHGVTVEAVEELLRFVSVVHRGVLRRCVLPTSVGGQSIGPGEFVVPSIAAANHDVTWLPEAATLDVGRTRTRHLAFGAGPHQCLGQHLARLEMRLALTTLAARTPSLRLATPVSPADLETDMTVLGIRQVLVTW